jgi:hypothetical protein
MDFQRSDVHVQLAQVRDAIRGGNWGVAELNARELSKHTVPAQVCDMEAYLEELKQTLVLAKASRANAAASLARVRAAARFQQNRSFTTLGRQNFAEPTENRREPPDSSPVRSDT